MVRIYDPDKHIIEVGENTKAVCKRFLDSGMTPEQVSERTEILKIYARRAFRFLHHRVQAVVLA